MKNAPADLSINQGTGANHNSPLPFLNKNVNFVGVVISVLIGLGLGRALEVMLYAN